MGRTILISSHILTEMADFCTSIAIMEEGRVLASGRVSEILARLQPALRLEIESAGSPQDLAAWLRPRQHVEQVQPGERIVQCRWMGAREELPQLHRQLVQDGVELISFSVKTDNLEDIYMRISGHRTS